MVHKLTKKQAIAAQLLASGDKITLVAQELKLKRQTITRWKRLAHFREEVEKNYREMSRKWGARNESLVMRAFGAAESLLEEEDNAALRARVSMAVLRMYVIPAVAERRRWGAYEESRLYYYKGERQAVFDPEPPEAG